jgi:hypothetical protein
MRQRLARAFKERRAGVHITDDDRLLTKVRAVCSVSCILCLCELFVQ